MKTMFFISRNKEKADRISPARLPVHCMNYA